MLSLISTFLSSTTGRFVGLAAGGTLAIAVAFTTGFVKGDEHAGAEQARAQVAALQRQIAARDDAAKKEAAQAEADKAALSAELERVKDAQAAISSGDCLSSVDADKLRGIWAKPKSKR